MESRYEGKIQLQRRTPNGCNRFSRSENHSAVIEHTFVLAAGEGSRSELRFSLTR